MSRFLPRWIHIGRGLAAIALLALAFGAQPVAAQADTLTNPKHFFWANGQPSPTGTVNSTTNDLVYHGGNAGSGAIGVESPPAVYPIYWGPDWVAGFNSPGEGGAGDSGARPS